MSNQRKNERQSCLVPVEGRTDSAFADIRTVDISHTGIGFVSRSALPLRKKIAVELMLAPDSEPVLVLGEVRWIKPMANSSLYRVGMKFVKSVAEGGRTRLKKYFD